MGDTDHTDDADQGVDENLTAVDHALFQLRRLWAKPHLAQQLSNQAGGRRIQLSNLMVISAISHLSHPASDPARTARLSGTPPATPAYARDPGETGPGTRDAGRTTGTGQPGPGPAPAETSGTEPAGEVTVGAVAERLDVDPSTASRLVAHAIEAGFVARRPSPVDARRASLVLTASGRRVKETAARFRLRYLERLMSGWSDADRADFARLLREFTAAAVETPFSVAGAEAIFEAARSAERRDPPAPGDRAE